MDLSVIALLRAQKANNDIAILKGGMANLQYEALTAATAEQIQAFVISKGYSDPNDWYKVKVIEKLNNNVWWYLTDDTGTHWKNIGTDTIQLDDNITDTATNAPRTNKMKAYVDSNFVAKHTGASGSDRYAYIFNSSGDTVLKIDGTPSATSTNLISSEGVFRFAVAKKTTTDDKNYIYGYNKADGQKSFDWSSKLNTVDLANVVYANDNAKNPITIAYDINATSKSIVQRDPNGRIYTESATSDSHVVNKKQMTDELDKKVDKVTGKDLSTNDFTDTLKTKLEGIDLSLYATVSALNLEHQGRVDGEVTLQNQINECATKDELDGQVEFLQSEIDDIPIVSGTNDGTNWNTITIGGVTKNIPSGGSGGYSPDGKSIKLNSSNQLETSIGGCVIDHYSATQIVTTDSSLTEVPGFTGVGFAVASYNPIAINDVITIKFLPKEGEDIIYLNKRTSQHHMYIIGGHNVDFIGTIDTAHGINIGKFVVEGMGTFFGVYKYEGTLAIDATTAKLTVDKLDYSEIEKISSQVVPIDNKTLLLDGNVLKSAVGGWKESGEITVTIAYKSGLTEFVGMTGVYVVNDYTGSFLEGDSVTANFKYSSTEYVDETATAINYTITIDGKTYDLFGIQFSTLPGMYLGFVDDGKGGKALVIVNQSTATLEVTYASLDASVTRTGEIYHALDGRYLPVDGTSVKLDSSNKLHVDVPTNYLEYIDVEGGQLKVYSSQGVVSYYEPVTGAHDGTNWTNITIGGVSKAIPSGGSGGGYSPDGKTIILDSSNKLSTAAGGWDETTTTQKLICSASGLTRHASATVIYKINDVSNDIALGDVVNGYIKDEDLGIEVNFDNAEFKNIELKIYGETVTYKACVDTTGKIYVLYRVFDETLKEKLCVYDPTSLGITSTTTIKLTADTTTHNYHKIDYNYIPVTGTRATNYYNCAAINFGSTTMQVSVVKGNSQQTGAENLHEITIDDMTYDNQHVRDIVETGNPREWEVQMDTDTTKWLLAGKENFIINATMSNANNFSGTIGDKEFGRLVDSFQDLDIILELVGLTTTSEHTFTIKLDNLVINSATNDITCYFIHTLDNSTALKWEFKISGTAVGDDHAITGKGTTL